MKICDCVKVYFIFMMDPGADHGQDRLWGHEVWLWRGGCFLDQHIEKDTIWNVIHGTIV